MSTPQEDDRLMIRLVVVVITAILGLIVLGMVGCPQYNVYSQRKSGEAQLAEATSNRTIKTLEAKATAEAAKSLAEADVERARGVAQANQIIGESLNKNEKYLTWLFIEALKDGKGDVIYIPTEAGLPILEAGRVGIGQKSFAPIAAAIVESTKK